MAFQGPGPFWLFNTGADDSANNRIIRDTDPGSTDSASTTGTVGTSGAGDYRFRPSTTAVKVAYTTTGQNAGWNMTAANTNAPDGVSKRRIPAGSWSMGGGVGVQSGTGYPAGTSTTVRVNVYARQVSNNALRYLGTLNTTVIPVALQIVNWTATGSLSEVVLDVGETIQVEVWYTVPNALVTSYVLTFIIGTGYTIAIPGTGLGTIYVRSQTDSAPAVDVSPVSRKYVAPRINTETLTPSQVLALRQVLARVLPETVVGSDSLGRIYKAARALTENVGIVSDLLLRQVLFRRIDAENYPTTSTLAAAFAGTRTIAEALSPSDGLGRVFVGSRQVAETVGPANEALGRQVKFNRGLNETLATSDSLARQVVYRRGPTENTSTIESLFRQLNYVRKVQDDLASGGTIEITKPLPLILVDEDVALSIGGNLYTRT